MRRAIDTKKVMWNLSGGAQILLYVLYIKNNRQVFHQRVSKHNTKRRKKRPYINRLIDKKPIVKYLYWN